MSTRREEAAINRDGHMKYPALFAAILLASCTSKTITGFDHYGCERVVVHDTDRTTAAVDSVKYYQCGEGEA